VENDVNGLLFDNARNFEWQLRRFLVDADLRKCLSRPDPKRFSAALEGERLATILAALVV
ncbi:MAG: hypothetical protein L3J63_13415, partial [Geopsychrobacter sp.]|nr:hypothetical protein [Geopsychrobacter sp.]